MQRATASTRNVLVGGLVVLLLSITAVGDVSAQCGRCGSCGVSKAKPVTKPKTPKVKTAKPATNPFTVMKVEPKQESIPRTKSPPKTTSQSRPKVSTPAATSSLPKIVSDSPEDANAKSKSSKEQDQGSTASAEDNRRQSLDRANSRLGYEDVQEADGMETLPIEVNHAAHMQTIGALGLLLQAAGLDAAQNNTGLCAGGYARLCRVAAREAAKRLKKALDAARDQARKAAEKARERAQKKIDAENRKKQKKLKAKKKAAEREQRKRERRAKKDKRYRDRQERERRLREDRDRLDRDGRKLEKDGKKLADDRKGLDEEERRLRREEGDARKNDPNCRSAACKGIQEQRRANSRAITENARAQGQFQSRQARFQGQVQNHARQADRLERQKDAGYGMNKDEYRSHLSDKRNAKAQADVFKAKNGVADARARADQARKQFGSKSPQYRRAQAELRQQEAGLKQAQSFAEKSHAHAVKSKAYMHGLKDEYKQYEEAQKADALARAGKRYKGDLADHRTNYQDFADKLREAQHVSGLSDQQLAERIDILDTADQRLQQAMDNPGQPLPPLSGKAIDLYNRDVAHRDQLKKQLADLDQGFSDAASHGPVFADAAKGYQEARQRLLDDIGRAEQGLDRFDVLLETEDHIDVMHAADRRMRQAVDSVGGKVPPPSGAVYDKFNRARAERKAALQKQIDELDAGMQRAMTMGPVFSDAARGYGQARANLVEQMAKVDESLDGFEPLNIAETVADTTRRVNSALADMRKDVPYTADGEIDADKLARRVIMMGRSQVELSKLSGEMAGLQKKSAAGTLSSREKRRLNQLLTTMRTMREGLKKSGVAVSVGKDGTLRVKATTVAGGVSWNAASDAVRENIAEVNRTKQRIADLKKQPKPADLLPNPGQTRPLNPVQAGATRARPKPEALNAAQMQALILSNPIAGGVHLLMQQAQKLAAMQAAGAAGAAPRSVSKKPVATLRSEQETAAQKALKLRQQANTRIREAKKAEQEAREAIEKARDTRDSNERYAQTQVRRAEAYEKLRGNAEVRAQDHRTEAARLRELAAQLEKKAVQTEALAVKPGSDRDLARAAREAAGNLRSDAKDLRVRAGKQDAEAAVDDGEAQRYTGERDRYIQEARDEIKEANEAGEIARAKIEEAQKKAGLAQSAAADANAAIREEHSARSELAYKQQVTFNKLISDLPSGTYFSDMDPDKRTRWLKDNVPNWNRMDTEQRMKVLDAIDYAETKTQASEAGAKLDQFIADKRLDPEGMRVRAAKINVMKLELEKLEGQWTQTGEEQRRVRILKNEIKRAQVAISRDVQQFGELREEVESKVQELKKAQWANDPKLRQQEIDTRVDGYARAKGELQLALSTADERTRAFNQRIIDERRKLQAAKKNGDSAAETAAQTAIERLESANTAWREQDKTNISALEKIVESRRDDVVLGSISDNLSEISTDKRLDALADQRLAQGDTLQQRLQQARGNVQSVVKGVDTTAEKFDPWGAVVKAYDKTGVAASAVVGGGIGLVKGGAKGIYEFGKLVLWEPIDAVGEDLEATMDLALGWRTNAFGNDNMQFVDGILTDPGSASMKMLLGLGKQIHDTVTAVGRVSDAFAGDSGQLAFEASMKVGENVGEFVLDPSLLVGGWGKLGTVLKAGSKASTTVKVLDKAVDGLRVLDDVAAGVIGTTLGAGGKLVERSARAIGLPVDQFLREVKFSLRQAQLLGEVPGGFAGVTADVGGDAFADAARAMDAPLNEAMAAIPGGKQFLPENALAPPGRGGPISPRAGPELAGLSRLPDVDLPSAGNALDGVPRAAADPIGGSPFNQPQRIGAQQPVPGVDPRRINVDYNHNANGQLTLRRSDNTVLQLNQANLLGEGSFSRAYSVPGTENLATGYRGQAVKLTPAGDGAMDAIGRGAVESVGKPGIIKTPKVHAKYQIDQAPIMPHSRDPLDFDRAKDFRGGTLTVTDRTPPVFSSAEAAGSIRAPDGRMTAGQAIAFNRGMQELNKKGFAWLDNKGDNFTFELNGPPGSDNWTLVVVDPGGIVPVKATAGKTAADNARSLQKAVDAPPQGLVDGYNGGDNARAATRQKHQDGLAKEFDKVVDWDKLKTTTGQSYETLRYPREGREAATLPYFPGNSANYPKLRQVAGAADEVLDKAERVLRASSPTPPSLPGDLGVLRGPVRPGESVPTLPDSSAATLGLPDPMGATPVLAKADSLPLTLRDRLPESLAPTSLDRQPIPPTIGSAIRDSRFPTVIDGRPIPPTIGDALPGSRVPTVIDGRPIPPTIGDALPDSRAPTVIDGRPIPPTIGGKLPDSRVPTVIDGRPIPPTIGNALPDSRAPTLVDRKPIPPTVGEHLPDTSAPTLVDSAKPGWANEPVAWSTLPDGQPLAPAPNPFVDRSASTLVEPASRPAPSGSVVDRNTPTVPDTRAPRPPVADGSASRYPGHIEGQPVGGRSGVEGQLACENCALVAGEAMLKDMGLVAAERPQKMMRAFAIERGMLQPQLPGTPGGMQVDNVRDYMRANGVPDALMDTPPLTGSQMGEAANAGKEVMAIIRTGNGGHHWVRIEGMTTDAAGRKWLSYGEGGRAKGISRRMTEDEFTRINSPPGDIAGQYRSLVIDRPKLTEAHLLEGRAEVSARALDGAEALARQQTGGPLTGAVAPPGGARPMGGAPGRQPAPFKTQALHQGDMPAVKGSGLPPGPAAPAPVLRNVQVLPDGTTRLWEGRRSSDIRFGPELGAGAQTKVFDDAVDPGAAFKVTKDVDQVAATLDRNGYAFAKGMSAEVRNQVVRTPTIHGQVKVNYSNDPGLQGATISRVDKAPPTLQQRMGDRMMDKRPMTTAEAIDFHTAQRAFNDEGLVWMDNKYNNYGFEPVPGTEYQRVVVHDPGGIVPIKGETAARRREIARDFQRAVSAPPPDLVDQFRLAEVEVVQFERAIESAMSLPQSPMRTQALQTLYQRLGDARSRMMAPVHAHKRQVAEQFGKHIDFDRLGVNSVYDIPFNTINGFMFERQRVLMRLDDNPRAMARAIWEMSETPPPGATLH